ncbi:MAG: Crp/Fnr family transcriptional regulator [Deltaproteobacteria bacterium]|nr:Crp/Fnr family transcriptional regulator [Deltaproteobacteria bacterium]
MLRAIKQLRKKYSVGQCLFTSEEAGTHCFVILKGTIELLNRSSGNDQVVSTLGPGDILGEKAIVSEEPYQHTLTARAKIETEVIQFEKRDLPTIETQFPDFKTRLLETVTHRLNKANEFIKVLQTEDAFEKVRAFVDYHIHYSGLSEHAPIRPETIIAALRCDPTMVEESLQRLVKEKALSENKGEYQVAHAALLKKKRVA